MTRGLLVKNTNNGEKAEFWRCQYEDVRRTGLILVPDDPAEHQEQHCVVNMKTFGERVLF
jgi:hypothetical protein